MLNITFEVLGAGAAALAVVPSSTKMLTVENASVAIRFDSPLTVVLR